MRPATLRLTAADEGQERCELLRRLALDVARGAGVLRERQRRLAATARWRCGTSAADHVKTDLLDELLDEFSRLPGTDAACLRDGVAATVAECTTLRGADYLERCSMLLADAAGGVLTLARSLPPEAAWRRQELLGIASHLAWCGHKDAEQHASLSAAPELRPLP